MELLIETGRVSLDHENQSKESSDQDLEREFVMAYLDYLILQSISLQKDIQQEMEMIEYGKKVKQESKPQQSSSALEDGEKVDGRVKTTMQYSGPLLSQQGKVFVDVFEKYEHYSHFAPL